MSTFNSFLRPFISKYAKLESTLWQLRKIVKLYLYKQQLEWTV